MKVVKYNDCTFSAVKKPGGWFYWVKRDNDPKSLEELKAEALGPFKTEAIALKRAMASVMQGRLTNEEKA